MAMGTGRVEASALIRGAHSCHTADRLPGTASGKRKQYVSAYPQLLSCSIGRKTDWVSDGQNDLLIISTLDLLQGILLVHPPSRSLFAREIYMNVRRGSDDSLDAPRLRLTASSGPP